MAIRFNGLTAEQFIPGTVEVVTNVFSLEWSGGETIMLLVSIYSNDGQQVDDFFFVTGGVDLPAGTETQLGFVSFLLDHGGQDSTILLERVRGHMADGLYLDTPILEVVQYEGFREAVSEYEAQDGKIVVAFDHWAKTKGIEFTD